MDIPCQTYNIYLNNPFVDLSRLLGLDNYSKIIVLCDENTERDCLPLLKGHIAEYHLISIESGEKNKTIETCLTIWRQLVQIGADRKSLMINLGGGVIGDMGGFCASTYMRGIDFIQMPTTLLSQVDASVGSKLGVDLDSNKNLIGLFNDPVAVYINTEFLASLDPRELTSGFAEVIKHALIKDQKLWKQIQSFKTLNEKEIQWDAIVQRSVEIKKEVVEQDPKEAGVRKILNFGHSIGHAIESERMLTDNPLTHGEAISIGMICEAHISLQKSLISQESLEEIVRYILLHFKKDAHYSPIVENILNRMSKDKKNVIGDKLLSLLDGEGSCTFNVVVSDNEVHLALDYYASLV